MKLKQYWKEFMKNLQSFLFKTLTSLSFLMIVFYFGYIIYYSVVSFNTLKVLVGCTSLYIMIHLNKNL